ncbi:MAG: transposase [Rheinheimera sp.]|nr:transposase [Rheinheimera sp.]
MSGFVGIDIAAKTVDLVVRNDDKTSKSEQFSQTPDGHAAVVRKLQKLAPELIVMEATGIYYLDLAVALAKANLPVAVINPKSFHHFAALKLNGSKTDAVDAALLAEFAQCMRPRLWTLPQDEQLDFAILAGSSTGLTASRISGKESSACADVQRHDAADAD